MNLTEELARRVIEALPGPHHPDLLPLLAAGFSRGLAVIPDPTPGSRRLYIVLGSPLEATPPDDPDFLPTLVIGERRQEQHRYLSKTGGVAWWFRWRARGGRTTKSPGSCNSNLVRASTTSFAWTPIDGDLPEPVAHTPDPDGFGDYEWFDLRRVPLGTIVYRVDSSGQVRLYQRLDLRRKIWGMVDVMATADVVDLHGIVAGLQAEHGVDLTLPEYNVDIPLMATVPKDLILPLRSRTAKRNHKRRLARAAAALAAADEGVADDATPAAPAGANDLVPDETNADSTP